MLVRVLNKYYFFYPNYTEKGGYNTKYRFKKEPAEQLLNPYYTEKVCYSHAYIWRLTILHRERHHLSVNVIRLVKIIMTFIIPRSSAFFSQWKISSIQSWYQDCIAIVHGLVFH